jgi:hypothetical protein
VKDSPIDYDSVKLLEDRQLFVDKHQSFLSLLMMTDDGDGGGGDDDDVIVCHEDKVLYNELAEVPDISQDNSIVCISRKRKQYRCNPYLVNDL